MFGRVAGEEAAAVAQGVAGLDTRVVKVAIIVVRPTMMVAQGLPEVTVVLGHLGLLVRQVVLVVARRYACSTQLALAVVEPRLDMHSEKILGR